MITKECVKISLELVSLSSEKSLLYNVLISSENNPKMSVLSDRLECYVSFEFQPNNIFATIQQDGTNGQRGAASAEPWSNSVRQRTH